MKRDHVRMMGDPEGSGDMLFFCRACGDSYLFRLPSGLSTAAGAGKGYAKDHRRCGMRLEEERNELLTLLDHRFFQLLERE